jgi:hypothetical protein
MKANTPGAIYWSDYIRLLMASGTFTHELYASKWASLHGSYDHYKSLGGHLSHPLPWRNA